MKIAFYAPMKPPDHPLPSGDREVARLLMRALAAGEHEVVVASRFQSWDGTGSRLRQQRLQRIGRRCARRLVQRLQRCAPADRPAVWVTYHVYHKAPDWIGPEVAAALDIPYLVVEASHAAKQQRGPWALGHAAAADAIRAADCVIALNSNDLPGLAAVRSRGVVFLPPFVPVPEPQTERNRMADRAALAQRYRLPASQPWLIAVAMMRADCKLDSYRLLARALRDLSDCPVTLVVIGDGPARARVVDAFANLPRHRVCWLGELDGTQVSRWLWAADLCVWPAVKEAYGMALLEGQARGVPVVAGRCGGVPDIIAHGETGLLVEQTPAELAAAVRRLLHDPALRHRMSRAARRKVETRHSLDAAQRYLYGITLDAIARRRHRSAGTQHG